LKKWSKTCSYQPFLKVGLAQSFPKVGLAQSFPKVGLAQPFLKVGLAQSFPKVGLAQPFLKVGLAQSFPKVGLAQPFLKVGLAQPFLKVDKVDINHSFIFCRYQINMSLDPVSLYLSRIFSFNKSKLSCMRVNCSLVYLRFSWLYG